MRTFGRLLTLVVVLAFAVGPFAPARAGASQMQPPAVDDTHAAMAGMDASPGDCAPCKGSPGAMKDCLPPCMSAAGFVPQDAVPLSVLAAIYGPRLDGSLAGAENRPDPYPPRPIVLS